VAFASAPKGLCVVLEAMDPLRSFAWIQGLLDVAIAVARLRAFECFGQPLDNASEKSGCGTHLMLQRRSVNSAANIHMLAQPCG
jgi:hypothetical protein